MTQEFKNLKTTRLVDQYLHDSGSLVIYGPISEGSHPIDRIYFNPHKDIYFLADVKTKARRIKYADTGIDKNDFDKYKKIQEKLNLDLFLFFVDDWLGTCYGGKLNNLKKYAEVGNKSYPSFEYTRSGFQLVYFPLKNMQTYFSLSDDQIKHLKDLSSSNY